MKMVTVLVEGREVSRVQLNNRDEAARLTPSMARAAINIAAGDAVGTVTDEHRSYRVTMHATRLIHEK